MEPYFFQSRVRVEKITGVSCVSELDRSGSRNWVPKSTRLGSRSRESKEIRNSTPHLCNNKYEDDVTEKFNSLKTVFFK